MRLGRIDRRWSAWMVAGVFACAAYPFLPHGGRAAALLFIAVGLASITVMIVGLRRNRPVNALGWYLFAAGQFSWVLGDIIFRYEHIVLHSTAYPSPADPFYLIAYPLFVAGLLGIGRGRIRRELPGLLDAAIIATGVGLVYWVFLISPTVDADGMSALVRTLTVGYPSCDVLVFAVAVRLLTGGNRPFSMDLLAAGIGLLIVADTVYSLAVANSSYNGGVSDAGWLLAYVLWAGAMLHPSASRPTVVEAAPMGFGPARLALLAGCTLLSPAVLFIQGARHLADLNWVAVAVGAVVLFSLVLTRMSGFVNQVQKQAHQLEDLAMSDELTGLANRRRFLQRAREAMQTGSPQVAILDLTAFKNINDRLGHVAGDRVLAAVGERLATHLRDGDLVARLGGDEFAVLVPDATDAEGDAVLERLSAALRTPIVGVDFELLIGAHFGIADAIGTDDPDEVLRRADVAMFAAKGLGEESRRYCEGLDLQAREAARIGEELRNALDTGQFRLVYQPIVALPHGQIVSVEALVRWVHPDRGLVGPVDFIPVAEQNGVIVELGAWILRTACAQFVVWRDTLGDAAPQQMSVNVSARQLAEPGFAELVASVLARTGMGAPHLVVEVTETAVFGGGQAVRAVTDLHELGVRIALDDFGTGHSSLGLLQTVPVDVLKVDKSFVDNITMAGRHSVIATALIQVADGLGLSAVAEGVETAEQADVLHRMGYQLAQGYHFGRPVTEPDFLGAGLAVGS